MKYFLGIDPGVSGALALVSEDRQSLDYIRTPREFSELAILLRNLEKKFSIAYAVIERVHSMPAQGVKSTFTFGTSAGAWDMALHLLKIPFSKVQPKAWQAELLDADLRARKDKKKSVIQVNRLFPEIELAKSKHNEADAILLAMYARSLYTLDYKDLG